MTLCQQFENPTRLCQAVSQAPLSNWNLPHTPTQASGCSLGQNPSHPCLLYRCLTSRRWTAWKQIVSSPTCSPLLTPPGTTLDLLRLTLPEQHKHKLNRQLMISRSAACLIWWETGWCRWLRRRSRCSLSFTLLVLSSKDSMLTGA